MATRQQGDAFKFPDEKDGKNTQPPQDELQIEVATGDEVEIIDDTPEQDRNRRPLDRQVDDPSEEELQAYSDNVKTRIKELTHARHDERREKERLQRERDELERALQAQLARNKQIADRYTEGEKQYAATAVAAAKAELEAAKAKLKKAKDEFDSDAELEAQDALMAAHIKLREAEAFKPGAMQAENSVVQTRPSEGTPPQPDKTLLDWQAKNQWFGKPGYEDLTGYAMGVDVKLTNQGIRPGSAEYFEKIDAAMKTAFPQVFSTQRDAQTPTNTSRAPSTVVAPASRSNGPRKVQLTQTQLTLAKRLGLTPQQYAMELVKLEKQNA